MTVRVGLREPAGNGVKLARMEYAFEDVERSRAFLAHDLPDPAFEQAVHDAGPAVDRYLTDDHTWARAVPV